MEDWAIMGMEELAA
jgi:hypothetical protein